MGSVLPGYAQHVVPAPHASHGHPVHAAEVKKPSHVPSVQTWSLLHSTPQLPVTDEQCSGLVDSCVSV